MASYVASPSSTPHNSIHDYNDHNESQSLPSLSNQTFPKPNSLTLDQPDDKLIPHSFIKPSLHESANSSKKAQRQNYLPCRPSPSNGNLSQLSKVIGEDLHDKPPTKFPSLTLGSPRDPREFSVSNHKHKDHHESHIHNHNHTHTHDHHHDKDADHQHEHIHTSVKEPRSKFTNSLLPAATRWPLLHAILLEKDSRRIFYFMSLNFGFMLIQAFYGYITDSLGLLSDSIHMFFDCLALGVGLFAAIASKRSPSHRFPFGFGKIESLSGFGNGVFLILISIEIVFEAIERLAEGRETKHLGELLIVSSLGLIVNLVGMACFGHHGHHGHVGHDHGEKCSKNPHVHAPIVGIETSRLKNHYHEGHDNHDNHEKHEIKMTKPDDALLGHAHTESHTHVVHSHSHDDDNMHGIFLHVLADTMGSAAVIISTLLIYFTGFSGWDPIASCLIAILIFLSSIPLIKKSAKKLLLTLPDEIEYNLRDTLAGVSDLRGVSNYYAPRFWVCDSSNLGEKERVLGVIHIAATRGSDLDEVRQRTQDFFRTRGIDTVVQVEGNDDLNCWCGRKNKLRTSTLK